MREPQQRNNCNRGKKWPQNGQPRNTYFQTKI